MQPVVSLDEAQFERVKSLLRDKLPTQIASRVFNRALKRAGTTARAELSKQITSKYTIKSKRAKEDISLISAKDSAAILIKGRHVDAADFKITPEFRIGGPRPKLIVKKGAGGVLPNSFFAIVGTGGHQGIFTRIGKSGGQETAFRLPAGSGARTPNVKKWLPIRELSGPAVAQIARTVLDTTDLQEKVMDTFAKRVKHELGREMERAAR